MNAHIVFGLFALYVAATSLYLVLAGQQDGVLLLLRRFWGRTVGHSIYFVARVACPLLICVLFLGWGVKHYDAEAVIHSKAPNLTLNVQYYRDIIHSWQKDSSVDPSDIVYGA